MINAIIRGFEKDTTKTMRDRIQIYIENEQNILKGANTIDASGHSVYIGIAFDDKANDIYDSLKKHSKDIEQGKPIKMYGTFGQNKTFWIEDIV